MKKLLSLGILCATAIAAPLAAHATGITGSVSVSLTVTSVNGNSTQGAVNLATTPVTSVGLSTDPGASLTGNTNGDFTVVGSGTNATTSANLFPFSGFTLDIQGVGDFTETSVSAPQTTNFGGQTTITWAVTGNFDPSAGGVFDGDPDTTATVLLTISNNGAYGGTAILNTPAFPPTTTVTPEPSSLVLLGTGLLGAVGAMRRRFKA